MVYVCNDGNVAQLLCIHRMGYFETTGCGFVLDFAAPKRLDGTGTCPNGRALWLNAEKLSR
jgi:hypothetical protein